MIHDNKLLVLKVIICMLPPLSGHNMCTRGQVLSISLWIELLHHVNGAGDMILVILGLV